MDIRRIWDTCTHWLSNAVTNKSEDVMLIFTDKLPSATRAATINKINEVAAALGINPNWLMAVINFETAGTFRTDIQNPYTNATGLIQFMPTTATSLGTSISQLKQMTHIEQLEWVKKYYWPYRSRIKSFVDLYLATFFPAAIGKPDDWVLQTSKLSPGIIAQQNPVFDTNKDGQVTVGEIKRVILTKVPAQYAKYILEKPATRIITMLLVAGAMVWMAKEQNWL